MARYEMKDLGIARKFLGMDIEYGEDGQIKVHVASYLEDVLERHGLLDCNPVSTPMLNTEKLVPAIDSDALADRAEYQQIVGEVMFAGLVARPDIMCAISKLSQFGTNPTSTHLQAAKHLLRYLKGTIRLGITYSAPPQEPHAFSDSDWAGDVNSRRSRTGYLIKLNNGAIIWRTILQLTVALSTTEAEYMAMAEALKEIMWLRQFLIDLDYGDPDLATTLFTDNQGALALAENPVSHARSKHIDIRHHFIRNAVIAGTVFVQYIPTDSMTADSLTKALGRQKHERCLELMGMS